MLGSTVLDVAIGMIFVFLLLSLIASVVQELLASFMQLRAANLLRGIRSLFSGDTFNGKDLVDSIYTHGLVRGLFSDPGHDLQKTAAQPSANAQGAQGAAETKPTKEKVPGAEIFDWLRYALRGLIGIEPEKNVTGVSNQLKLPNYIPSRTFALALIDLLNKENKTGADALVSITDSLTKEIEANVGNKAAEALHTLALDAAAAKDGLITFQRNVENWYNDGMDRVSGWYKRYTQRVLLVIGFLIAVSFNVSTARVAQTLWFDRDTRDAMSKAADEYVKAHPNPPPPVANGNDQPAAPPTSGAGSGAAPPAGGGTPAKTDATDSSSTPGDLVKKLEESADAFNDVTSKTLLPVGWKHSLDFYWNAFLADMPGGTWKGVKLLFGWFITACAISLGAPFWFDMLNKIMVVRSTIKPQEKSQPEKSKS
jgi:hypothetical protein